MKVIFLDVDGVLNNDFTSTRTSSGADFVDNIFVERLKRLIDTTGAIVVMSSSWRYGRNCELHGDDFNELIEKLKEFDIKIEDYTPELHTDDKGIEIDEYLSEHPEIENYVILDDDEISIHTEKQIRTLNRYGLTDEDVDEAIKILKT